MQLPSDSGPVKPLAVSISDPSDLPVAPVALSFVSDPPAPVASARPPRGRPERASLTRRAAGWGADLALLSALFGAHVLVAACLVGDRRTVSSMLLAAPGLWMALGGSLAVAWSWVFVGLWGRTPGMALTRQRLSLLQGGRLTPFAAFARALLAALSGAPALFGFALALFDTRAQTLHDKLCRCVAVVD